ncbi:MAG: hypothetical protein AAF811_12005 [Pseudomonadota bacterium]
MSYVVTNKWMRAGYAEGLRAMFAEKAWIEFVADFGHAKKFFPDADVFPSVIVVRKPADSDAPDETQVCAVSRDDVPEKDLEEFVGNNTYALPRTYLARTPWALEPPDVSSLMAKLRERATTLRDVVPSLPVNGIKTGLNEAFLITAEEEDALVAADPNCKQLIKPYLRGQDIRRWCSGGADQRMILLPSSADHAWPWCQSATEVEAEEIFQATYPSIYERMKRFESYKDKKSGKQRGLRHREDQGRFWWELRPCAYYQVFSKAKIIYQAIQFHPRYMYVQDEVYGNNKTYFLPAESPALLAALNSPLLWWFGWRHFIHMKDEALSNDQVKIADLPIAERLLTSHKISESARKLIQSSRSVIDVDLSTIRWLAHEFGLDRTPAKLKAVSALTADDFVRAVRGGLPRSRRLSASEISELHREYADTIASAREIRSEILVLENQLSGLVNEAYGLTPEEVALMWRTAPPRMPFTPAGLASDAHEPDENDNWDEDE